MHRHIGQGGSFGNKTLHYSDPTTFLKKQTQPKLPKATKFQYTSKRKSPLVTRAAARNSPAQRSSTMRRTKGKTNFITQNALAVIGAEPGGREKKKTDYLKKADYGKTPAYLKRVNKEIEMETEYVRRVMEREQQDLVARQPQMRKLPDDERKQLVGDLKLKWQQVNQMYQGMTHLVDLDTIGKIRRKEQYEAQLKQLESSIEKLSRPVVYIQDEAAMY